VNDVHQLDLKGPIYLKGSSHKYYLWTAKTFVHPALRRKSAKAFVPFTLKIERFKQLPVMIDEQLLISDIDPRQDIMPG
jgi:hypothetical protein